jgi:hypothetical protein
MSAEANFSGDHTMEAAVPEANVQMNDSSGQAQENHQVPLAALQSERAQRQKLAEELQMMKDHLALMDSHRRQPQEKPRDVFDELPDDDIPTWGEVKKVLSEREKVYQTKITEMQMGQRNPDYAEVISKYLPDVIKANPSLRKSLEITQDYELAYYLAKNSDSYKSEHKRAQKNSDAEKIMQNSQQAGSLSSMGTVSPVNAAKRYRDMSDTDFRKEVQKNLGYA